MNISDNDRTRKLFSPDQFLRLGTGKCILTNPGYVSRDEVGIPVLQKIKIPEQVRNLQAWSKTKWNEKVRPRLGDRSPQPKLTREELRAYTETMLRERFAEAERILPLPTDVQKQSTAAPNNGNKLQDQKMIRQLKSVF